MQPFGEHEAFVFRVLVVIADAEVHPAHGGASAGGIAERADVSEAAAVGLRVAGGLGQVGAEFITTLCALSAPCGSQA
jgi:hypothetical protein